MVVSDVKSHLAARDETRQTPMEQFRRSSPTDRQTDRQTDRRTDRQVEMIALNMSFLEIFAQTAPLHSNVSKNELGLRNEQKI